MKALATAIAVLGCLSVVSSAGPAAAGAAGEATKDGVKVGITMLRLDRIRNHDSQRGSAGKAAFEYTSMIACPHNSPNGKGSGVVCQGATQGCAGNTPQQGQGPLMRLYRRPLGANGAAATAWETLGTTCLAGLVPGTPVLGMAQILAAFHNTPWARPTVHIQPEGNVTLVTLATYFEVKWPTAGFQPGEVDTTALLGSQIRIRPTLKGYSYFFGDGTSLGPTPSPGGTYPDGDVSHAYPKAGIYTTHIDITYGGEYSVAGGAWLPINDAVIVGGPAQTLTVKTARARLVTR